MGLKYYKLLDLLNRRGLKKTDLYQVVSTKTVAKLSKGGYISTESIERICEFLNCQPGEIMEYVEPVTDTQTKEEFETMIEYDEDGEIVNVKEYKNAPHRIDFE